MFTWSRYNQGWAEIISLLWTRANHCLYSSISGIANEQKKLYGTQFHPEVDLTERGMDMLRNFLFEIAGCTNNFTVQNRQMGCIREIQEKVDKSKVLVRKL